MELRRMVTVACTCLLFIVLSSCGGSKGDPGDLGAKGDAGSTGSTGATGAAGAAGVGISSNQKIGAIAGDFCNVGSPDSNDCFFDGGQRVTFGDGTILLTAEWRATEDTKGPDRSSIAMIIPPTTSSAYKVLSQFASSTSSGTKKVFVSYARSPETIKLVHDTTSADILTSDDTTLATLTLSDW